MLEQAASRCPYCDAPTLVAGDRTHVPHLSWCRFAARPSTPPRLTLLEPTPEVEPIDYESDVDQGTGKSLTIRAAMTPVAQTHPGSRRCNVSGNDFGGDAA